MNAAALLAQAGTPNLWNQFLTATVAGLVTAALYAIAASGLVVTYTTSGVFNFAHGAFGMMAGFTFWQLSEDWGLPPVVALVLVVCVIAPLFGAVVERVLMRGLAGTSELIKLVVTVSLLLALIGLAPVIWDPTVGRSVPEFFADVDPVTIAGVGISIHRIIIFVAALLVAVVLRLVLYSTRVGVAMRAVVDDRELAQLNGARPGLTSMTSWGLGAGLAALAGVLGAPISTLEAVALTLLVFNAYAAPIMGRLKSVPLTFLGAIVLGLAQSYVSSFVKAGDSNALERALTNFEENSGWTLANLQAAMPAIVLFAVMLFIRPDRQRSHSMTQLRGGSKVPTWRVTTIGAVLLPLATAALTVIVPETFRISLAGGFGLGLVALSLVPLAGYAGQISLAQLSFAAIGVVVMGNWGTTSPLLGLVLAVVLAAAVGALVSLPALRLSGVYLALMTAAFALMLSRLVLNQQRIMPQGNLRVPPLRDGWDTSSARMMVFAVAFVLVGVLVVAVRRSAFGRRLVAMKDSPDACATLGLDLTRTNLMVFALSAGIAGLGGALLATTAQVDQFSFETSLAVTMMAVVGGITFVAGAFFGGLLLGAFQSILGPLFSANSVGYFSAFSLQVSQLTKFMPGLMGISLGRNPSGAMSELGAGFRAVGERLEALVVSVVGVAVLWLMRAAHVPEAPTWLRRFDDLPAINGWQFTAAVLVWVFAVTPLLPLLFADSGVRRRWPMLVPGAVGVAVALAITWVPAEGQPAFWSTLMASNGWRVVLMVLLAVVTGALMTRLAGPLETPADDAVTPALDLVGIDGPFSRAEVIEAEAALGVDEDEIAAYGELVGAGGSAR